MSNRSFRRPEPPDVPARYGGGRGNRYSIRPVTIESADIATSARSIPVSTSVVMEVLQEGTQRRFALKQLLASRAEDRDEYRAFMHEAKLGMELRHPNLIRVYEFVKRSDPAVLRDGAVHRPSSEAADRTAVDLPDAEDAACTGSSSRSASALAYMHDKGWVHRDVKPENILFNKSGEVRVIDYALARRGRDAVFSRCSAARSPARGPRLTWRPSRSVASRPSPAVDIYSFGITCYELACGRPPFRANSSQELLEKHLNERPLPADDP